MNGIKPNNKIGIENSSSLNKFRLLIFKLLNIRVNGEETCTCDVTPIKSSSILGEHGFGFERNEQGNPIRFPHIGNVIIKDNVEIGAFNTVSRGSIDNTFIDEFTKIDDHVHIAHNVYIGKKNIICAGTIFGGSSKIGNSNFIGLNSTIKDGTKIGNKNFIGQSTNVVKSVEDNNLIYGNPGEIIKK